MEQIKLKDLQKYPIGKDGIQVEHTDLDDNATTIQTITMLCYDCICFEDASDYYFSKDLDGYNPIIRPILLPLTDLYKPMENGETPIVELAKIAFPRWVGWYLNDEYNYAMTKKMNMAIF